MSDSPPSTSGSADSGLPPTLESLRKEVDQIKKKQDEESHGISAKIALWVAVVGLIGACISLPAGFDDLHARFWGKPETDVRRGDELGMTYAPQSSSVTFSFNALITNEGKKDDYISGPTGRLSNDSTVSTVYLPLAQTDFDCSSQGVRLSRPIPVRKDVPLPLSCSVTSVVPKPSREPFQSAGTYRLKISLVGRDQKEHFLDFCFPLSEKDLQEMFASRTPVTSRVLSSECR